MARAGRVSSTVIHDIDLYAINQGGTLRANIFLDLALGAAYTRLAIGPDGKISTENKGTLFVIGQ